MHTKLRELLRPESDFFREVQRETESQIQRGSRCVSRLSKRGFPIVFDHKENSFDSQTFLSFVKDSILTNLTCDFFRTPKPSPCKACGIQCEQFERAHTIKERPEIAKEALKLVLEKNRVDNVFELSEFLKQFIELHRKYPIAFLCSRCHMELDKVVRKSIRPKTLTYEELKKIDYTGVKPMEFRISCPFGKETCEVPNSMARIRFLIFQGVPTKHLRSSFSSVRGEPGHFRNESRHTFKGWCGEEDGLPFEFFLRGSSNNGILKDILKAIFEEKFEEKQPYKTTLFQFDVRLKLRFPNGEIVEITNQKPK